MSKNLQDLRKKIDMIDREILDLLIKRCDSVKEVGKLKSATAHENSFCFIKPAREASLVKNILNNWQGDFPKEALAQIWRIIISASTSLEQEISILVSDSDLEDYYLIREYYGSFSKILLDSLNNIAHRLHQGEAKIAIFSWEDIVFSWRSLLDFDEKFKFFAQIPLLNLEKSKKKLLAFGHVELDFTADDYFKLFITKKPETGFNLREEYLGDGLFLVETKAEEGLEIIKFLGAYASQIIL
jgi:chorismate mutase